MNPDAARYSAQARQLTREYMAGTPKSFAAFRDLVQLLLSLTVMADNEFVNLASLGGDPTRRALGGNGGPTFPVRLRDGRWLRIAYSLHLAPHLGKEMRLKVEQSSVQYQANQFDDDGGLREIFRYDYLRATTAGTPMPTSTSTRT